MGTSRSTATYHRALIRPALSGWLALAAIACGAGDGGNTLDSPRLLASQRDSGDVLPAAAGDDLTAERAQPAPDRAGVTSVAVPIGSTGFTRGRSTAVVKASMDRVRATVLSFDRYPEFMPHYKKCRLLGRTPPGGWDVYMEVSALQGAVTMWARVEIQKPALADGAETYSSRFVSGNVQDLQATWRLEKIDAQTTRLSLDVFLRPKLPLPKSLLNAENLEGSASAVAAIRTRIEQPQDANR
ncbi:type II toxin-antitoxin system RatA family toxin [Sorangium sp. So ce1153]|uniref:type II toxin-antitoxin system RatA family toxin n=1 Tax=Sorangium sp. So ce1153 TaxID=3133333 RepID=UPI003F5E2D20